MNFTFVVAALIICGFFSGKAQGAVCESSTKTLGDQLIAAKEMCQDAAGVQMSHSGLIYDPYFNSNGCFAEDDAEADACSPPGWNEMSLVQKAEYVSMTYEELLAVHKLDYSKRILTCKVMRESTFRPQDKATTSSAVGLSQVLKGTAIDLFERQRWGFTPKVKGFEDVGDGEEYLDRMSTSIAAQLELGLAVLHQKSIDNKTTQIKTILENYYGGSPADNRNYANKIY